jgi:hypothetical protein
MGFCQMLGGIALVRSRRGFVEILMLMYRNMRQSNLADGFQGFVERLTGDSYQRFMERMILVMGILFITAGLAFMLLGALGGRAPLTIQKALPLTGTSTLLSTSVLGYRGTHTVYTPEADDDADGHRYRRDARCDERYCPISRQSADHRQHGDHAHGENDSQTLGSSDMEQRVKG